MVKRILIKVFVVSVVVSIEQILQFALFDNSFSKTY